MAAGDITAKRTNYSDFPCNVFDGVDDYVEIPHAAQQLGANLSNGFTISAWINPRGFGENSTGNIISKSTGTGAQNGFYFAVGNNSNVFVGLNNGTLRGSANNSNPLRIWTHALITISAGQLINFYVNGTLSGNANQDLVQAISTITTTNAMRIGNRSTATDRTFDGSIKDVKMWNRVLTTTEITEEYQNKNHTDGLIHHFKLGGDYKDYGSVGVTATNSGSIANTTIPLKLQTNAKQLNLAAVTDKIIALPVSGRVGIFTMIGANRAAA
jgi:hypothetical protein